MPRKSPQASELADVVNFKPHYLGHRGRLQERAEQEDGAKRAGSLADTLDKGGENRKPGRDGSTEYANGDLRPIMQASHICEHHSADHYVMEVGHHEISVSDVHIYAQSC